MKIELRNLKQEQRRLSQMERDFPIPSEVLRNVDARSPSPSTVKDAAASGLSRRWTRELNHLRAELATVQVGGGLWWFWEWLCHTHGQMV